MDSFVFFSPTAVQGETAIASSSSSYSSGFIKSNEIQVDTKTKESELDQLFSDLKDCISSIQSIHKANNSQNFGSQSIVDLFSQGEISPYIRRLSSTIITISNITITHDMENRTERLEPVIQNMVSWKEKSQTNFGIAALLVSLCPLLMSRVLVSRTILEESMIIDQTNSDGNSRHWYQQLILYLHQRFPHVLKTAFDETLRNLYDTSNSSTAILNQLSIILDIPELFLELVDIVLPSLDIQDLAKKEQYHTLALQRSTLNPILSALSKHGSSHLPDIYDRNPSLVNALLVLFSVSGLQACQDPSSLLHHSELFYNSLGPKIFGDLMNHILQTQDTATSSIAFGELLLQLVTCLSMLTEGKNISLKTHSDQFYTDLHHICQKYLQQWSNYLIVCLQQVNFESPFTSNSAETHSIIQNNGSTTNSRHLVHQILVSPHLTNLKTRLVNETISTGIIKNPTTTWPIISELIHTEQETKPSGFSHAILRGKAHDPEIIPGSFHAHLSDQQLEQMLQSIHSSIQQDEVTQTTDSLFEPFKSRADFFAQRLSLTWLLSLIDEKPISIAKISANILGIVCKRVPRLHLNSFFLKLADYYESLIPNSTAGINSLRELNMQSLDKFTHSRHPARYERSLIIRNLLMNLYNQDPLLPSLIIPTLVNNLIGYHPHTDKLNSNITYESNAQSMRARPTSSNNNSLKDQQAPLAQHEDRPIVQSIQEDSVINSKGATMPQRIESRKRKRKGGADPISSPLPGTIEETPKKKRLSTTNRGVEEDYDADGSFAEDEIGLSAKFQLLECFARSNQNFVYIDILVDSFLAFVDSKHPKGVEWKKYSEILPQKPTFEKDIWIEQLFQKKPILFSILQLIARVPPQLYRCNHILLSLLATSIGNWYKETSVQSTQSIWYSHTMKIIFLLNTASFLPQQLAIVQNIIPYIPSSQVFLVLLAVWTFLTENPPSFQDIELSNHLVPPGTIAYKKMTPPTTPAALEWASTILQFVLRRNVQAIPQHCFILFSSVKCDAPP